MSAPETVVEPKKICFVLQDTGHIYGAQRATLDLIKGLQEVEGWEVHVILFQELRVELPVEDFAGALRELGVLCITPPVAQAYSKILIRTIRDYITVNGIRLVHSVGYKADLHALRASQHHARFKTVSTVHGWFFLPDWKEKLYYHINRWTLRRMDRVVVLSRHYENMLAQDGFEVVRIPSGFRNMAIPPSEARPVYAAGMLSRFTGEKNIPMFVRAVKRLHAERPDARFLIAGEGADEATLKQLVRDEGLEAVIDFPGFLSRETFFSQVQVPVICSNIENLPYAVMEAMAHGLAGVATRVGGLPDLIEDGQTGYLVEPRDDAALAEKIQRLLDHPEEAKAFGQAGLEKLQREFSPAQAVEAHLALYEELLNS